MMWKDFKGTVEKLYNGIDEESSRFGVFKANVDIIQAANNKTLLYSWGVN